MTSCLFCTEWHSSNRSKPLQVLNFHFYRATQRFFIGRKSNFCRSYCCQLKRAGQSSYYYAAVCAACGDVACWLSVRSRILRNRTAALDCFNYDPLAVAPRRRHTPARNSLSIKLFVSGRRPRFSTQRVVVFCTYVNHY